MGRGKKWTLAIDWDGVLHSYTTPFIATHIISDGPVEGSIAWLIEMSKHFALVINSARLDTTESPEQNQRVVEAMKEWLLKHDCPPEVVDELHFHPKPKALVYVDDRGYRFSGKNFPSKGDIHLHLHPWGDVEDRPSEPAYVRMRDTEVIAACGADPSKWADAFAQHHPQVDVGTLIGWFLNAMEQAVIAHIKRSQRGEP